MLVSEISSSPLLQGSADAAVYESMGVRAAQSTPLLSRTGGLIGMISTHWRAPHTPSERAATARILARQGADWIERQRSAETMPR
jgi:hypothetical protein